MAIRVRQVQMRTMEHEKRADPELPELIRNYYRESTVRERMCEFLGKTDIRRASAAYITATDGSFEYSAPASPGRLFDYLKAGLEVDRSLWDRDLLIADIDLEYHNFDQPAAAWLNPARAFALEQPMLDATLRVLGKASVVPLILVSGRGYHLVWGVNRKSRAFSRLARLGRVTPSLQARYARTCSPTGMAVDPELGRAFAGLGCVLEFVGHRVIGEAAGSSALPIQLTAIEVGPGAGGREIASFDLSEYGDPLDGRHIRLPFSTYLKPRQQLWALGAEGVRALLPLYEIPLGEMTAAQAIGVARDTAAVIGLSKHGSVTIPNESEPMDSLIDDYQRSELSAFHEGFYRQLGDPSSQTGPVRIPGAPPCVEWFLEHPNDWLLRPAILQHVSRVLTALDWSPSAICRLICASYSRDCDWGGTWERLDPANRAIFYTRLFTGMIATGCDQLIDFNCVSQKEKDQCIIPDCASNLITYRDMLLSRRPH